MQMEDTTPLKAGKKLKLRKIMDASASLIRDSFEIRDLALQHDTLFSHSIDFEIVQEAFQKC